MPLSDTIYVGTSGWSYDHWKGTFYPERLPSHQLLNAYAQEFNTVEINNTFYQLPNEDSVKSWYESVPDDFSFAVKASRFITHQKKLIDPEDSVRSFFEHITLLHDKLGPILFQLPPMWHKDHDRLAAFIDVLPDEYQYVFEFRDKTWFDDEIISLLDSAEIACCVYDLEGYTSPIYDTADFYYIRLHGPSAAYEGSYNQDLLKNWVTHIDEWTKQDKSVYCYFNNDYRAHAPQDARRLIEMLAKLEHA